MVAAHLPCDVSGSSHPPPHRITPTQDSATSCRPPLTTPLTPPPQPPLPKDAYYPSFVPRFAILVSTSTSSSGGRESSPQPCQAYPTPCSAYHSFSPFACQTRCLPARRALVLACFLLFATPAGLPPTYVCVPAATLRPRPSLPALPLRWRLGGWLLQHRKATSPPPLTPTCTIPQH